MRQNSGFTLLQMCFLVVILGLMAVGAANLYKTFVRQAYMDQTDERQKAVQLALKQFYVKRAEELGTGNGYFPCPADPGLVPTHPNYGRSINPDPAKIGGRCRPGDPIAGNTARGGGARIGAVPARTLGLSDDYMKEPSGYLFIYAITEALTEEPTVNTDTSGNITNGVIDIRDAAAPGTSLLTGRVGANGCAGQSAPAAPYGANSALYAIISPGRNGACSWINGTLKSCAGISASDAENTDGDNIFVGGTYFCRKNRDNGAWVFTYLPRVSY